MCARGETARRSAFAAALLFAVGCAVGPDFTRPKPPEVDRYTSSALPPQTATADGRSQRFAPAAVLDAEWWKAFRSRELAARIQRALAANPTLEGARATLRRSEDELRAGYAVFLPTIDAGSALGRERSS